MLETYLTETIAKTFCFAKKKQETHMLPACDHLQLKAIWITDRWQKHRTQYMHFDPFRSLQKRWITLRSGCRTHIFYLIGGMIQ